MTVVATRLSMAFASMVLTTSCAHQYVEQLAQVSANTESWGIPTETGIDTCRASLAAPKASTGAELDASRIRLINWNIQKKRQQGWQEDLDALGSEKDLVLIQEASLRHDTAAGIDSSKHWAFAPGYLTDGEITGVMTLSSIRPLTQCSFMTLEPVLRTPKATSITEYGLTATDETLVVVNLHAVNFSTGLGAFQQQFDQIRRVLKDHSGPIILSGDFNTWRKKRMQIVDNLAEALELKSLEFGDDRRVRFFGSVLDHIFVRGLTAVDAGTESVDTSDHNPMSATFSM